jgi:DNA-directed RNA polymerase specialized sigma24 family protein
MTTPRKFTFERSREQAEEILRLYEGGLTPKEICAHYDLPSINVWQKIRQAKKWRARAAEARA